MDLLERLRNTSKLDDYARLEAADEIERLRRALRTLLLNYGAALPDANKDQRSIRAARAALGE